MEKFVDELLVTMAMLAPFLMLGFLIAGFLHAYVPRSLLVRAMGGTGVGPISRASLMGIPLPLCSCSVIPVATELRRQGAGRGATAAFMVSTPETGVDSISASVAVLHPLLVIARPVAAMVTSILTGLAVERTTADVPPPRMPAGCSHHHHHGGEEHDTEAAVRGPGRGLWGGVRYAFHDLLGEIAPYLVPALLLTALLGTVLDPEAITKWEVAPWLQRLLLLGAGIPVYVCATSATPVAAAMIVAGVSPGAALVFLLAGPATNLVTIAAVRATLGRPGAVVYVAVVAVVSFVFGTLLDFFWSDLAGADAPAHLHDHGLTWLHWSCAVLLGVMLVWHLGRKLQARFPPREQPLRAATQVSAVTLCSRVLGLVRDVMMFRMLDFSWALGSFVLAWMIPNLLRRLFGEGALAASFIPAYAKARTEHGEAAAKKLLATVTGALLAVLIGVSAIVMLTAFFLPGEAVGSARDAVSAATQGRLLLDLTIVLFPYAIPICLAAVLTGALNSHGTFALPAAAPVVLNVFWIAGLTYAWATGMQDPAEIVSLVAWLLLLAGIRAAVAVVRAAVPPRPPRAPPAPRGPMTRRTGWCGRWVRR